MSGRLLVSEKAEGVAHEDDGFDGEAEDDEIRDVTKEFRVVVGTLTELPILRSLAEFQSCYGSRPILDTDWI